MPSRRSALNWLSPNMNAAIISAVVAIGLSWWIIPSVQREQKLADRQYEMFAEVATVSTKALADTWNVFFASNNRKDIDAQRRHRDQLQSAAAQMHGIRTKLSVLFEDQSIADTWEQMMQTFHDAYYPLGRGEKLSETELNQALAPICPLLGSLIAKMHSETEMSGLRRFGRWLRNLWTPAAASSSSPPSTHTPPENSARKAFSCR